MTLALGPQVTRAFVEQIMGLPVSIHVRASDPRRGDIEGAVANVFAHLRKADAVFSPWRADSELLRLRRGSLRRDEVHPWFDEVEELCAFAEEVTLGLFTSILTGPDGTIGFDPTGLVKGWAVARAADYLADVPGIGYSINAGGDIVCGVGRQVSDLDSLWRIGIEDPRAPGTIVDVVPITVGAIATSGAAARGAHIIDPRSGSALDKAGSFSVIGPDLTICDILATAGFIDPSQTRSIMAERFPAYGFREH